MNIAVLADTLLLVYCGRDESVQGALGKAGPVGRSGEVVNQCWIRMVLSDPMYFKI